MKKVVIFIIAIGFAFTVNAQEAFNVTGTVFDKDQNPIAFANIIVSDAGSKKIAKGTISDENGKFDLELKKGSYILEIKYLGYEDWQKEINIERNIVFEKIVLNESLNELNEVVVLGKKELITRKGDKIIMNIANNSFVEGKNASEILKYAPNVWVDPNSSAISLKGVSATILINGKPSNMSGDNLMSYLNGLSDKELKSIEVISNPSARYDAEGLGGVINIITNKADVKGVKGNIYSQLIFAKFFSHRNSLSLNSRITDKLSINTFLLYQENDNLSEEDRRETISSPSTVYNYKKIDSTESADAFANFDLQYDLTTNDQLVLQYRVLDSDSERTQNNDLLITDTQNTGSNGFYGNERTTNYYALGLNYNRKLDSLGKNLNVIADYYNSDAVSNNRYTNLFFDQSNQLIDENNRRSISKASYQIFSSQLDFKSPIKEKGNLELGGKFSIVKNKSNSIFENLIAGQYEIDTNFTNAFDYDEQIAAAYGSYSVNGLFNANIDLQVGVRGEYTSGEGKIVATGFRLKKDYFNLFPSLFLTKQFENKSSIGLSYSRRINRPNYRRFNPTIFYITDFTSQVGNPDLDPSYTNAFEFNYNSSNLNALVYFNDINGEAREILTQLTDTELRYQWRNIEKTFIYGVSLSYNKKINNWWTVFANSSWYGKNYTTTFEDAVANIDITKGTFQGRLASQFKLPYDINTEVSFEYNGPETYGQFESGENYAFYLNVSKKVTKRLSFYIKVIDPFNKLRYIFKNSQPGYQTFQFRNNFNQALQFSLQYNFDFGGKTKNVRYKRSSQNLKNRSN